jgi:hypothetical protein
LPPDDESLETQPFAARVVVIEEKGVLAGDPG